MQEAAATPATPLGLVEDEIRRFLSGQNPEVLCIKGRWGVGKTYTWNTLVRSSRALLNGWRYSYVSLFGVDSLDELKYSVFENAVPADIAGEAPDLKTAKKNFLSVMEGIGRKAAPFIEKLPFLKPYIGALGPVWFLAVRKTIVCVDDLERHGKNLRVQDVLGLISNLKEHRNCRVAIILNEEALEQGDDAQAFKKYLEKVVDIIVKFEPTAIECARIALPGEGEIESNLRERCVALGISNIRTIKKLERVARRIEELTAAYDRQVLRNVIGAAVLLGWILYEPHVAPPIDFVEERVVRRFRGGAKEFSERETGGTRC